MKTISVVIEDEMYRRLKAISEDDRRTMSNWVALAIEREIERYEKNHV